MHCLIYTSHLWIFGNISPCRSSSVKFFLPLCWQFRAGNLVGILQESFGPTEQQPQIRASSEHSCKSIWNLKTEHVCQLRSAKCSSSVLLYRVCNLELCRIAIRYLIMCSGTASLRSTLAMVILGISPSLHIHGLGGTRGIMGMTFTTT